jgi:hypothetical protein
MTWALTQEVFPLSRLVMKKRYRPSKRFRLARKRGSAVLKRKSQPSPPVAGTTQAESNCGGESRLIAAFADVYSYRRDSTGLARAALKACDPMVRAATTKAKTAEIGNVHQWMAVR